MQDAGLVDFVLTSDPAFTSPEGLSVASTLGEVLQVSGDAELVLEPGFSHHVLLPSGWRAAFGDGGFTGEIAGDPPTGESTVSFFFKREH